MKKDQQTPAYTNHLVHEKSPYLLQHAHNPVNWYPWGEEAFEKAKKEDKPVFLSIGYSTCHWCHVMERESFEDIEVANLLNEHFISIKVDREERPDIDQIYMTVCQRMTGSGGWPLNLFLTPEKEPFFAGTYFPKHRYYNRPGLIDLIQQLSHAYQNEREKIKDITSQLTEMLQYEQEKSTEEIEPTAAYDCFKELKNSFDKTYGGFGGAPKFPIPHYLTFLLKQYKLTDDPLALQMVTKTLDQMADGGIYDHIGFGFARYSTDEKWLVPHFEKMLYDNALLLGVYTEAYQVTKNERYRHIAREIITFVERELLDESGGFYSAIDADSEGVEGKYYVWDREEVLDILGEERGKLYCEMYNITKRGNFEGKSIPNRIHKRADEIASKYGLTESEIKEKLEYARRTLFEVRETRIYPHLDDKILTSWNGYIIAALAQFAKVFDGKESLEMAERALAFIEKNLVVDGRLMARYRDKEVKYKGYLDDYANLVWALINLYEATFDVSYLEKAIHYTDQALQLFWDEASGGFYFYGKDAEQLLSRPKELYDGATPSGNSVMAVQLFRLFEYTSDMRYMNLLSEMEKAFKIQVENYPSGYSHFLQMVLLKQMKRKEIIVIGKKDSTAWNKAKKTIQEEFLPHVTTLFAENERELAQVFQDGQTYAIKDEETTFYVCENFSCQKPTTDVKEVLRQLEV